MFSTAIVVRQVQLNSGERRTGHIVQHDRQRSTVDFRCDHVAVSTSSTDAPTEIMRYRAFYRAARSYDTVLAAASTFCSVSGPEKDASIYSWYM